MLLEKYVKRFNEDSEKWESVELLSTLKVGDCIKVYDKIGNTIVDKDGATIFEVLKTPYLHYGDLVLDIKKVR